MSGIQIAQASPTPVLNGGRAFSQFYNFLRTNPHLAAAFRALPPVMIMDAQRALLINDDGTIARTREHYVTNIADYTGLPYHYVDEAIGPYLEMADEQTALVGNLIQGLIQQAKGLFPDAAAMTPGLGGLGSAGASQQLYEAAAALTSSPTVSEPVVQPGRNAATTVPPPPRVDARGEALAASTEAVAGLNQDLGEWHTDGGLSFYTAEQYGQHPGTTNRAFAYAGEPDQPLAIRYELTVPVPVYTADYAITTVYQTVPLVLEGPASTQAEFYAREEVQAAWQNKLAYYAESGWPLQANFAESGLTPSGLQERAEAVLNNSQPLAAVVAGGRPAHRTPGLDTPDMSHQAQQEQSVAPELPIQDEGVVSGGHEPESLGGIGEGEVPESLTEHNQPQPRPNTNNLEMPQTTFPPISEIPEESSGEEEQPEPITRETSNLPLFAEANQRRWANDTPSSEMESSGQNADRITDIRSYVQPAQHLEGALNSSGFKIIENRQGVTIPQSSVAAFEQAIANLPSSLRETLTVAPGDLTLSTVIDENHPSYSGEKMPAYITDNGDIVVSAYNQSYNFVYDRWDLVLKSEEELTHYLLHEIGHRVHLISQNGTFTIPELIQQAHKQDVASLSLGERRQYAYYIQGTDSGRGYIEGIATQSGQEEAIAQISASIFGDNTVPGLHLRFPNTAHVILSELQGLNEQEINSLLLENGSTTFEGQLEQSGLENSEIVQNNSNLPTATAMTLSLRQRLTSFSQQYDYPLNSGYILHDVLAHNFLRTNPPTEIGELRAAVDEFIGKYLVTKAVLPDLNIRQLKRIVEIARVRLAAEINKPIEEIVTVEDSTIQEWYQLVMNRGQYLLDQGVINEIDVYTEEGLEQLLEIEVPQDW